MKLLHGTVASYIIGFLLSVILTMFAYNLVLLHLNSYYQVIPHIIIIPAILILALLQLFAQLIFFLHLGKESRPKWNLLFFIATFCAILVIVIGSLWIMDHLNYNMTPKQMNQYINDQSGF